MRIAKQARAFVGTTRGAGWDNSDAAKVREHPAASDPSSILETNGG